MKIPRKKLLIIGDSGVGRIFIRTGSYPKQPKPGACDIFEFAIRVNDPSMILEVYESCAAKEYDVLRSLYYHDTRVFTLCYAVDQPNSLKQAVEKWLPEARHYCPGVPIILVGLKKDLRQNSEMNENDQQFVSIEQAVSVAQEIKAYKHWECSAKTGEGVSELFDYVTQVALEYKPTKKWLKCAVM